MTHQLLPYKYKTVFIMKKVATMNISERQIRNIVRESIRRSLKNRLNEWRWDDPVEHDRQKAIWARFGYEMIDREDDEPIFVDKEGNEFVLDDYGHHLVPIENNFDDKSDDEFMMEEVDMGQVPSAQDGSDRANSRIWNDLQLKNNPEYRKLKSEVHRLRVGMDDAEARGEDMEAYTEKIKALNRRINGIIDAVSRKGISPTYLREGIKNYETYVLVNDSDGSVIGNYTEGNGYDAKAEAIMDAKERAGHDRFGSYTVYGCTEGGYDDTTIVFSTAGEDVHLFNLEESVVKRCVAKVLKEYDHHDPDSEWESEVERADAMRDQEKDKYVDSLEEDSKYTETTNYNVDASETLGYVNKAFDTLDRMMKRMFERSDLFGENLGRMAFETARKLRGMKDSLNKEFTNSQSPKVSRTLRPRKM